jgi:hypothetical protein
MPNVVVMPEIYRPVPLNAGGFLITVLASRKDASDDEIFHQSGPEGKGPGLTFILGTSPSTSCRVSFIVA